MKTTILYGLLLFSMVASLCGCTADELPASSEASGDVESFSITVADAGGYASVSGGTPTRATENDYTTTFVEGDQIGVFAVKKNALMPGVNNLCLTAKNNGGYLVWLDNAGKSPLRYPGATYYAYYPYQPNLSSDKLDFSATDANSFFANVIKDWTPATNQGSSTAYSAQDLMIAANQPTGKQLSFSMSHCMALVVLDLPKTEYTFTNVPAIPPYIIDAPGTRFNSFIPYRMGVGTYRYLVNPAALKGLLSGSYTSVDNRVAEWTIDAKAITAGTYKVFTVDKDIEVSHNLQVGDFYMKDGSLVTVAKQDELDEEQKASCLGIVMKVGKDANDNTSYKQKNGADMDKIHGYVLALYDAKTEKIAWSRKEYSDLLTDDGFVGYENTQKIINYINANNLPLDNWYAIYYAVFSYDEKYTSPDNSSGWFLPSVVEAEIWNKGKQSSESDFLLNIVKKVTGDSSYIWYNNNDSLHYWTSTIKLWSRMIVILQNNGNMGSHGSLNRVRSVLVF